MNWHNRYKAMKKGLGLTNSSIGDIIGNTPDSIKNVTQPNKDLPRWLKLAIVVYEKCNNHEKQQSKESEIVDIQNECMKIHSQYGTSEMANYKIQLLFDKLLSQQKETKQVSDEELEDYAKEYANLQGVKGYTDTQKIILRSQLFVFYKWMINKLTTKEN